MKVGLVLDHFDPRRGGVEQWTYQLAQRLLAAGHEVHVVASGFGEKQVACGIVPHWYRSSSTRVGSAEEAKRVLLSLDLDIIHDMGTGYYCDVFQPHTGSRYSAFEQNLLLDSPWTRPGKRLMANLLPRYRDFDELLSRQYASDNRLIIGISEMVRRDLIRYHNVENSRIRLVYNGVDTDRFSPAHREECREEARARHQLGKDVVFLIVAHNFRLKGVPALLKAAAALHQEGLPFKVVVVGGKRFGPFTRMARSWGIASKVSFVGSVENSAPYYAAADVYVQPTFYDPCSLVVLEAFGCGLPVITTSRNGASELMTEGHEGHVLNDPGDWRSLADCMRSMLDDRKRAEMGANARALALRNTLDQNVDNVMKVYREALVLKNGATRRVA